MWDNHFIFYLKQSYYSDDGGSPFVLCVCLTSKATYIISRMVVYYKMTYVENTKYLHSLTHEYAAAW